MSALLQKLQLAPVRGRAPITGLVSVKDDTLSPKTIPEIVATREARFINGGKNDRCAAIDFIFFRYFEDGRSPQVAAYIVDNKRNEFSNQDIAELHRRVWLNGTAPLLYVERSTQVDILRCATGPEFWDKQLEKPIYKTAVEITDALDQEKLNRFSAFRLATGTFWEDPVNANWADATKGSHKSLIDAVIEADHNLNGNQAPIMRRLLLLFIFSKYLEDRGVFPTDWFRQYVNSADSFLSVLKAGNPKPVLRMLAELKEKFNGDIFDLPDLDESLNGKILTEFTTLLEARTIEKQRYLWDQYSFRYVPVEVLSHVYQHFAQSGTGAIYTPPFVADLILDRVLPYGRITGRETILDPTCGSAVFLVGAFRRLVYHWQGNNGWKPAPVSVLKNILKRSIFGVEMLEEATQVASLNLALAVCEVLHPKVIWDNLQFDTLIGRNLFQGDFFENLTDLKQTVPKGFSVIVGNPPFSSKLTKAATDTRRKDLCGISIPDKNIAYRVLEECCDMLAHSGTLCLLQPSGILYNSKTRDFTARLIRTHALDEVLDFVSIRNLFEAADTKAVALLFSRREPTEDHEILHLTFRRSKCVHERLGFELDHYDEHYIHQSRAETFPQIWKINLLGGGRLAELTEKVMQWPTLKDYISRMGWSHGEGFIVGNRKHEKKWLTGMPLLPTEGIKNSGIDYDSLTTVTETHFEASRGRDLFQSPLFLIRENEALPSAYWSDGPLAFLDKIVGVSAPKHGSADLKQFADRFTKTKKQLKTYCQIIGTQSLIGKSTAILKRDIDELPWPEEDGLESFAWWEKILLDDVAGIYAPLIRNGHKSHGMTKMVEVETLGTYATIFVKLLGSVYANLRASDSGSADGIAWQAFTFGDKPTLDWSDDWAKHLKKNLTGKSGASFLTNRIIRIYEANTLIIVKPDRLRNWIPSTAIRDADETLVDLQHQGF